jgi:hypothetical protein
MAMQPCSRLGVWSKPFAVISILGAVMLIYAGTQPPFDPILPLFPDLPTPRTGSPIR